MEGKMKRLDEESLRQMAEAPGAALVMFGHPTSRPTMAQAQAFAELWADCGEAAQFGYLDALMHEGAARRYAVRALPTTLLFRDGVLAAAFEGFHTRARLEAALTQTETPDRAAA
jgi:thioredoxin-like negative regulator of GroEL